jgi:glycosyltransferase involved in cell wall biosynthesis
MTNSQLVSVVIPSYNSARFVCEAVESALNQSYRPHEVIVVDDGSTDDTVQVLDRFRGSIRYVYRPNGGLSAARNTGIRESGGELIAFLDADDVWLPEKLKRQLACLAENPCAALVHSDVLYWDVATGQKTRQDRGRRHYVGSCYERFFQGNRVTPSTILIRRDCLSRVGFFDEGIRRPTTQDYDLCFRIARSHELAYVDQPLIHYRLHGMNFSKRTREMLEDELYVVRKALAADPGLVERVGRAVVNERLFRLLFGIGYHYYDDRDPSQARRHFLEALKYRPIDVYTWSLYLANLLPLAWVGRLRRLKAVIGCCGLPRGGTFVGPSLASPRQDEQ